MTDEQLHLAAEKAKNEAEYHIKKAGDCLVDRDQHRMNMHHTVAYVFNGLAGIFNEMRRAK